MNNETVIENLPLPQSTIFENNKKPKEARNKARNVYTRLFSTVLPYFKTSKIILSKTDGSIGNLEEIASASGHTIMNKCFKKISCAEKTVPLTYHSIKNSILRDLKKSPGGLKLLYGTANDKNSLLQELGFATKDEINTVFLWSAFCKNWDVLEELVRLGANINTAPSVFSYYEPIHGLTALHLAVFSGCPNSTRFLISQKINVNTINKCYSPLHCAALAKQDETAEILLDNEARLNSMTNGPGYETPLYIAVKVSIISKQSGFGLSEVISPVVITLSFMKPPQEKVKGGKSGDRAGHLMKYLKTGAQIYQEGKLADMSPLFLAAELGHPECLKIILDTKSVNCDQLRKSGNGNTALHLAAEKGHTECIEILLDNGADSNVTNLRSQSPLHLAVKANSYTSVVLFLKKGDANINIEDFNKRTPLHEAIELIADNRTDIVKVLLGNGADVNAQDQHGFTPLHIAALNELPHCVALLIADGADFSIESKTGISAVALIAKKMPAAFDAISEKFNQYITLGNNPECLNDIEMQLDFRTGLHHPNEYALLNAFIDAGHKEMLQTPFCTAFLYVTWCRIRRCYYGMIYNSVIFSLMLLVYVLTALAYDCDRRMKDLTAPNNTVYCKNKSYVFLRTSPLTLDIQWYILLYLTLSLAYRKTYGIRGFPSLKHYCLNMGNVLEWVCIFFVFLISSVYTGKVESWQVHSGGFAVISSWTNVMFLVGQLPFFGPYVEMFQKVQSEFFKLLLVYFSLLFGCTIGFCVFFPNSTAFANPLIGSISTLVMMTGDMNYDTLLDYEKEQTSVSMGRIGAQVVYTLFVLFVTIILMNLLIGIAVNDIEGLQKTADLSRLVRQAKMSSYIELSHLNRSKLSKAIMTLLRVVPKPYIGVLKCKPLDPAERALPKVILQAAYALARKRENDKKRVFSRTQSEKSSWKRVVNESFKQTYSQLRWTATLNQLVHKLDRNFVQISSLQAEINELKGIVKESRSDAPADKDF